MKYEARDAATYWETFGRPFRPFTGALLPLLRLDMCSLRVSLTSASAAELWLFLLIVFFITSAAFWLLPKVNQSSWCVESEKHGKFSRALRGFFENLYLSISGFFRGPTFGLSPTTGMRCVDLGFRFFVFVCVSGYTVCFPGLQFC